MGPIQSSEQELCLKHRRCLIELPPPHNKPINFHRIDSQRYAMAVLTGSFLRFAACASPSSAAIVADPDAALRFELILSFAIASR